MTAAVVEITLKPRPVVVGEDHSHVMMWTPERQWSCSCGHKATKAYPACEHAIRIARRLKPETANSLINARRAAGYRPSRMALEADRRVHPGEALSPTTY